MEKYNYLIIGGGVAGTTAAETIREKDKTGSIAIVNDELYSLYSRVMLSKPNFFLGKISMDAAWLKTQKWYEDQNIKFLGGRRTIDMDPEKKVLKLDDQSELEYEKLLISTGMSTRVWGVEGSDKKGIYSLRTMDDAKAIMEAIKSKKKAITVGGGFISFEMADLLRLAGLEVISLLRESYYWEPILDRESGGMIEKALEEHGVLIYRNAEAQKVLGTDSVSGVLLKDGKELTCDMIILGIGVASTLDWLKPKGLAMNRGILANEYLETNLPDVWVAGDIAEYNDLILEESVQMGNWVNAKEQGKTAGLNMAGAKEPFKFVSFYTTQGMGMSIGFVGDVRPGGDRIIIKRGSPEINSYARMLVVGKELVGATLINRNEDLNPIAKLIEKNIDVSSRYQELSDTNFDLKSLL